MNFLNRSQPITEDDLYALHLNELSPARARTVRRALADDAALAEESATIAATLSLLRPTPSEVSMTIDEAVLERNWQAVRPSLKTHELATNLWRPLVAGALLAAGLGVFIFCALQLNAPELAPAPNLSAAAHTPFARGLIAVNRGEQAGISPRAPANDRESSPTHPSSRDRTLSAQLFPPATTRLPEPFASGLHAIPLAPIPDRSPMAGLLALEPPPPLAALPALSLARLEPPSAPEPPDAAPSRATRYPALERLLRQAASRLTARASSISSPKRAGAHVKLRIPVETSLALGVNAQLNQHRTTSDGSSSQTQSLDASAGVQSSIRQSFRPWLGYAGTLGYTRTTEETLTPTVNNATTRDAIPASVFEATIAYLVKRRMRSRVEGFAAIGGGVLIFRPTDPGASGGARALPSTLTRQAGVAAVGVDYRLNPHVAVRAEYRALLFKYPDFGARVPRQLTLTSEPTLSITYNFGGRRKP